MHGDLSNENFGKVGNKLVALGEYRRFVSGKYIHSEYFLNFINVDYGTATEIAKPNTKVYLQNFPFGVKPYGIKMTMSKNAMKGGVRGIADDWWAFYCIGYQLYNVEYADIKKTIRLPWAYNSVQDLWKENSTASINKAIDETVKLHEKYPNLSVENLSLRIVQKKVYFNHLFKQ